MSQDDPNKLYYLILHPFDKKHIPIIYNQLVSLNIGSRPTMEITCLAQKVAFPIAQLPLEKALQLKKQLEEEPFIHEVPHKYRNSEDMLVRSDLWELPPPGEKLCRVDIVETVPAEITKAWKEEWKQQGF